MLPLRARLPREDKEIGLRDNDPRKNSSCVGALLMNIFKLSGFRGGLTISHRDFKSDCSAECVTRGGLKSIDEELNVFPPFLNMGNEKDDCSVDNSDDACIC
mmetsp:Transcript_14354/g.21028  ORF Transcript_14354/g.21028 Transcript_14354/m.21028 type:complete len:102 (+) Transcript_14354:1106-1411(+)